MDKQVFMSRSIFVLVSLVGLLLISSGATSKLGRHQDNFEKYFPQDYQLPTNVRIIDMPDENAKALIESRKQISNDRPLDLNNLTAISTSTDIEVSISRCRAVGLSCNPYEICAHTEYGLYCKCQSCPYLPVDTLCGSNGYTYDDLCHMTQISCLNNVPISGEYYGTCNEKTAVSPSHYEPPASKEELDFDADGTEHYTVFLQILKPNHVCESRGLYCHKYGHCLQSSDPLTQPECRCVYCKWTGTGKICASDGYFYPSVCEIKRMACLTNTSIYYSKQHTGPCVKGAISRFIRCQELDRRCSIHAECRWDLDSKSHRCHCTQKCDESVKPVCGTNAVTYKNLCQLELSACTNNANITKGYDGPCTKYLPMKGI